MIFTTSDGALLRWRTQMILGACNRASVTLSPTGRLAGWRAGGREGTNWAPGAAVLPLT